METGISLLDFAQQLRRKNADVQDIYFTLLDAAGVSPTLVLNRNAKAKESNLSPFYQKYEHQKMQSLYTQGGAANDSVRNLLKTSNLPVSKVRKYLHSKLPYTKSTFSTR